MNTLSEKRDLCVAAAFVLVILVLLLDVLFGLSDKAYRKLTGVGNGYVKNVSVDWAAEYPFPLTSAEADANAETPYEIYIKIVDRVKQELGELCTTDFKGRIPIVEGNLYFNKIMGVTEHPEIILLEDTKAIELNNGHLTQTTEKVDTDPVADVLEDFKLYLDKQGINFLYVQAPYKVDEKNTQLPEELGVTDYGNMNADRLLLSLKNKNVNALDLREEIWNEGLNHYDLFYRTDHHWRVETGIWAAGEISKYLNKNFSYNIDLSNYEKDCYDYITYPKIFLGSLGNKLTTALSTPEDFTVALPKAETNFDIETRSIGQNGTGDFSDCFIHKQYLNSGGGEITAYTTYLASDQALVRIHNNKIENGKRVLLIKDSFSNVMAPYMALGVENLDMIDTRAFGGSVRAYIEATKPDTVIDMRTATFSDAEEALWQLD